MNMKERRNYTSRFYLIGLFSGSRKLISLYAICFRAPDKCPTIRENCNSNFNSAMRCTYVHDADPLRRIAVSHVRDA